MWFHGLHSFKRDFVLWQKIRHPGAQFLRPAFYSLTALFTLLKQGLIFILMTGHQLDFDLEASISKAVMWVNLKVIIAGAEIITTACLCGQLAIAPPSRCQIETRCGFTNRSLRILNGLKQLGLKNCNWLSIPKPDQGEE
jgi:hypothetical protein